MRKIIFLFAVTILAFTAVAQTERDVTITQWSAREENGFIRVIGEVKNTYSNALGSVRIEIEYYDKSGKPLGVDRFTARDASVMAKDEVLAALEVIRPGETAPFERVRDVNKIKGQFGSCIIKAKGLLFKENPPISAAISNLEIKKQDKNFTVRGAYKATGKEPCKNPAVVIVGYDAAGKIQKLETFNFTVGNQKFNFVKSLAPGEAYNFSTIFYNNTSGNVTEVRVYPFYSAYF